MTSQMSLLWRHSLLTLSSLGSSTIGTSLGETGIVA